MTHPVETALVETIHHYLDQASHLLGVLEQHSDAEALMAVCVAPDSLDTGLHLAVAMQFAARALCLPGGDPVPEIDEPVSLRSLRALQASATGALSTAPELDWTARVQHTAGEAQLDQPVADYIARFALPNMLFHLTMAYAGLRHGGLRIGKVDFDGMHEY
ncbi:MAG: DUF1993 family protein [Pseudomonadota bacterium]